MSIQPSTILSPQQQRLMQAVQEGNEQTVRKLLETLDPNFKDDHGRTPLHIAASRNNTAIIQLLNERGASLDVTDATGITPLQEASRSKPRLGSAVVLDYMATLGPPTSNTKPKNEEKTRIDTFVVVLGVFEVAMLVLYGLFAKIDVKYDDLKRYPMFQDIHVMIFIGFGFLMTFLRKYGFSSIGLNMLVGIVGIQWYPLVQTFWKYVIHGKPTEVILNVSMMIQADFCAAALLITFGAVLGKTSAVQIVALSLVSVIFYALNEELSYVLGIADIGGSMIIHAFGAFFGLAASLALTPPKARGHPDNVSVYHSDMFAMIGTVFLWMYWPSFNAAFSDEMYTERAVVNTILSLTGSCLAAFLTSYIVHGEKRFLMVDIQNATLAGGVSMGTAANMAIHPGFSITIGIVAGVVSVLGYHRVQSTLERTIGLHDTCGVMNLHGMPSILGAVWGFIGSAITYGDTSVFPAPKATTASQQAAYQCAYLIITLSISLVSGYAGGLLVSKTLPGVTTYFGDEVNWKVPEVETPYYYDKRGENMHSSETKHNPFIVSTSIGSS